MNNILPCPFCGGEVELNTYDTWSFTKKSIINCFTCNLEMTVNIGSEDEDETRKLAIYQWNTRI